jgi:hypothetical protein
MNAQSTRWLRALIVLALVVPMSAAALNRSFEATPPAATITATATLVPPDGSTGVKATLTFTQSGTTLRVSGRATGLDPLKRYISLIYDPGSKPSGPTACIPSVLPPVGGLSFDQMQLGDWQPIGAGTRTFSAQRISSAFVPLRAIGTASIRRHDQTGPAAALPLIACGAVRVKQK